MPRVLSYHKGSISDALIDLFPHIGLDKAKLLDQRMLLIIIHLLCLYLFLYVKKELWHDPDQRSAFFINFALEHKFEMMDSEEWYKQSRTEIMETKVLYFLYKIKSTYYLVGSCGSDVLSQ